MLFQLAFTVAANPIAPAARSPMPIAKCPVNVKIAPMASSEPLTRAVTKPIGPCSASCIAVILNPMPNPSAIAPAARIAIPIAGWPRNVRIAPSASNPPATYREIVLMLSLIYDVMLPQFAATVDARPIAPAIIRPRPRGICAPENTRIAPIASNAPLTSATIFPKDPCSAFRISSQFSDTASQIAIAPRAISARPIGIFAPENVRIAPSARSAAPVNSSTIALN